MKVLVEAGPAQMKTSRILPLLVPAAVLGACEFVGNGVVPSVTGEAVATAPQARGAAPANGTATAGRPYVVIPFKDPAIDYQQSLYDAVSAALERWPEATFDLVAVAPAAESIEAARADMEQVKASLQSMGLPAERVSTRELTDPGIQGNEVRLYLR
jgi:hypothetical protein